MKEINSLLSALKRTYSEQGQTAKILLPALLLLAFCCLCSTLIALFPRGNPSNAVPSPNIFPTTGTQVTPTPLFDFDFPTFTPFPTLPPPSAFPTLTPLPTDSLTATQTSAAPAATATPIPTNTATPVPPTATTIRGPVVIIAVHKVAENVDIQNIDATAVDLGGWRLVSEAGNQSCNLSGSLGPGKVLRVWANRGPGFDCGLPNEIWVDNGADPAVLYNPQGVEVSRFP